MVTIGRILREAHHAVHGEDYYYYCYYRYKYNNNCYYCYCYYCCY